MSRTYRRKNLHQERRYHCSDWDWVWVRSDDGYEYYHRQKTWLEPGSKEYAVKAAQFHSDAHFGPLEPGPSWFRNMTAERPQRREAKRQLQLYAKNPEYVVILNSKDPLEYWS